MKHENLFKIYIPEPCHEDWDKMNSNKQGAFCKVCSKTVIDFSVKTDGEIQEFLQANLDKKICGRFKTHQLEETSRLKIQQPKFEFPKYLFPLSYSPARVFTMAIMLFASVALASCGNSETGGGEGTDSNRIEHIQGGTSVKPPEDSTKSNNEINKNIPPPEYPNPMGGVSIQQVKQEKAVQDSLRIDSAAYNMVGEVVLENKSDTVAVRNVKMGLIKPVHKEKEYMKGDVQHEK